MRVLVCGGRHLYDIEAVFKTLDALKPRPTEIIQGGAMGADAYARIWAMARGIKSTQVNAHWERDGKRAGPIRNLQMLKECKPELVVAFSGGKGTANMVKQAQKAGVPVMWA